jgi:hypothetical protein
MWRGGTDHHPVPPLAYWLAHPLTMPAVVDVLSRYSSQPTWEYYSHGIAFLRVFQQYPHGVRHTHKPGRFFALAYACCWGLQVPST